MWYNKAASSMAAGGYIQGYADGTFGANKPITRAEFVCLAARFATKTTGFASYTDVDNGHWAARIDCHLRLKRLGARAMRTAPSAPTSPSPEPRQ